ncbi:MAG: MMPL family transporter [Planctomycetota bacterium]|jgi:predicted RND superfamily exporter protein|nr:MMPL family transporter [Planctomycetota bacterium]
MRKRLLRAIARFSCRRHRLVLWTALGLTIASWAPPIVSYFRGGLHAPFDISGMLPQDVRAARDFTRAVTDFDSIDEAVVVFHLGNETEREPSARALRADPSLGDPAAVEARRLARGKYVDMAGRVADAVVDALLKDERVQGAFARKFRPEDRDYLLYEALPSFGLLLVGDEEIPRIKELLEPESIRRSVANVRRLTASSVSSALDLDELILLDAIGLASVFQRAMSRYGVGDASAAANGGYLVDKNNTMLLAVIQPDRPAQSIDFSAQATELIRDATDRAYRELVPDAARPSIRVEFGGGYEAAMRYTSHVNSNLFETLLTSLIGVLALFGLVFKRFGVLLYIGIPLLMVVSWTIGIGWIIYGQLNIISAAFAAVLVGLGIDYAIHIYNRYINERAAGSELEPAFEIAIENTGWGVIIGMVTTAVAFLSLLETRFSQLAEFGVLAGSGIALSCPVMLFVLPALLSWRYRESGERAATLRPAGLGLGRLGDWVERNAGTALALSALLALAAAVRLAGWPEALLFDERISSLRPPERVFELGGEIARAFSNRNPNSLMLLASGTSEEDAVEKAARLEEICRELEKIAIPDRNGVKQPLLAAYESILRYLPPPSGQRRMLGALRAADLSRALAVFREALAAEGLDEDFFGFTIALLQRHLERVEADRVVLPTDFNGTPLWRYVKRFVSRRREVIDLRRELPGKLVFPVTVASPAVARSEVIKARPGDSLTRDELLALYHAPSLTWQEQVKRVTVLEPSGWVIRTSVYPPLDESTRAGDPLVDEKWLGAVREKLGISEGGASPEGEPVLVGMAILAHELASIVKADFRKVSVAVFAICTVVLLLFFIRNPIRALWSLTPLMSGLLFLFGFMSAFGIHFNFVNILVVPIIIGLGVDNGIHLTERFFESGHSAKTIVADTGRALVVTALTSMCGFGSLAISGYEGIASMGRLTIHALGWMLFASLLSLPAILFAVYRRRRASAAGKPETDS